MTPVLVLHLVQHLGSCRRPAGVLHYDKDFDTLATHAGLEFEAVWIAPRGSID